MPPVGNLLKKQLQVTLCRPACAEKMLRDPSDCERGVDRLSQVIEREGERIIACYASDVAT